MKFIYDTATGGLSTDKEIPGITQKTNSELALAYGGLHLIGETMTLEFAKVIAQLYHSELRVK